ncbi:MAG TPA: DUF2182 domain-containing protein [Thermomicrobiales bacterium]|nr:DUF2182 domain-containing protein [Thermomicrobiales bacterium]
MTASSPETPRRGWRPVGPLAQGQWAILAILALLTVGAWALTVAMARSMNMPMGIAARGGAAGGMDGMASGGAMSGMTGMSGASDMAMSGAAAGGWSIAAVAWFLAAWTVMMAAMMFPAAAPMLVMFHRLSAQRRAQGAPFVSTWVFVAGYLLVWAAAGVVVYWLIQLASDAATRLGAGDRATWAPIALGATLIVAGVYQLTPLKRMCLGHCRSPLSFVMTHWREGRFGALRMGVAHGLYCLGCCWALFAVLVAAGVMSLAWMLLLTLVVFLEKVAPQGQRAAAAVGGAFILLGILVAAGAAAMPWMA